MALFGLSRETVIDLTVNIVPLVIILFFIGLFLLADPFWVGDGDLLTTVMSHVLLVVPFVLLAALTYVAGRRVQRAEEEPGLQRTEQ